MFNSNQVSYKIRHDQTAGQKYYIPVVIVKLPGQKPQTKDFPELECKTATKALEIADELWQQTYDEFKAAADKENAEKQTGIDAAVLAAAKVAAG